MKIILSRKGFDSIGQSFADEIFRVYARNHPGIELSAINTSRDIEKIIRRASNKVLSPFI